MDPCMKRTSGLQKIKKGPTMGPFSPSTVKGPSQRESLSRGFIVRG